MSQATHRCEVLPSGLTVLLSETRLAPVVEFQIWAGVGSADERDHERGLAHFHEHMLFKGTERRGVGDVASDVEGAGGRINAYTSYDVTVYHATVPADQLAVGVDVICDAVLHSTFDPGELEREIEVVLEEIRRSEDSPGHVLAEAVVTRALDVHPYRLPILGSTASVSSFDRERVRAFYERWYAPDNLTVVAVGDFDADLVIALVKEAFAGREPSGTRRNRPSEPPHTRLRTRVLAKPFERARIEFAYPAVALAHPDTPYLDLAAFVMGSGDSCRLVRSVKERAELCDRIDAGCYSPLDPGFFSLNIETDAERAADAIAAAVREVEMLRSAPVSADELEKARANFLASEHFERESISGQAHKLGAFQVTAGGYRVEETYLAAIRSATPADLQRVARQYLAPERLTVGALIPEAEAAALDDAKVAAAVARGVEHNALVFAAPRRSKTEGEIVSYELPGGAWLHVLPRREVPVVAARAAFSGGLLAEQESNSGITAFLTSMWLRGTRSRSAADFARAGESLAVEVDTFTGRSSLGVTFEAPSAQLVPAMDLMAELLLEPAFDPGELERERRETLAAIERRADRLAQRAFLLFSETHYRHHPYRMPQLGSAEAVTSFTRDQLEAHHDRLIWAENLSIGIAGDVDPDDVAQQFAIRLGELPSGNFEAPSPALEEAPTEIRSAEAKKDRAQAHLVIGFRGLCVTDPDRYTLDLISQLLAGQGGRLFLELRDKRSLAYTVSATNIEGVAPGYFAVYIATAPEKLEEARTGLLRELEKIVSEPVSAAEIARTKRYLTGNFAIDQQRNAVHAAHLSLDSLYGLGPASYREFPARIEAISAEDVERVTRRIIDLDKYTLAVVRP